LLYNKGMVNNWFNVIKQGVVKLVIFSIWVFFLFGIIGIVLFMLKPEYFFSAVYKFDSFEGYKIQSEIQNDFKNSNMDSILFNDMSYKNKYNPNNITEIENNNKTEEMSENILHYTVSDIKEDTGLRLYKNFRFQDINGVLSIPSIKVKGRIISGTDENIMEQGFWHVAVNGAWLEGGNMVIFGHRYFHIPPATDTFFNLDKVKVNDSIIIRTKLGQWNYHVKEVKIVSKYDKTIFENTKTPTLTLVTCHPLWTSKNRLVVIATLQTSFLYE